MLFRAFRGGKSIVKLYHFLKVKGLITVKKRFSPELMGDFLPFRYLIEFVSYNLKNRRSEVILPNGVIRWQAGFPAY